MGGRPRIVRGGSDDPSLSECRDVTIGVKIHSIHRLDTVEQVAFMDLLVVASWLEACLEGIPPNKLDWAIVWRSALQIGNIIDAEFLTGDFGHDACTSIDEGMITFVHHVRVNLAQ